MRLPEKVEETLEGLKKEHKHTVVVKFIRGGFYAYEAYTKWDKTLKRQRSYALYLGKIEMDGSLIPPHRKTHRTSGVRTINGYLRNRTAEAIEKMRLEENEQNIRIISALSTNARASYEEIASKAGILPQSVRYRVKQLEKMYGIKYITDAYAIFNLGFYRYIITIKFKGKKPDSAAIKKELEKESRVQLAMLTKGDFDVFIYTLFENPVELENWVYKLRQTNTFANYRAFWNVSYALISHGVIPVRDEFFDLIKDRVWHRTKETPRKHEGDIFYRQYAVLKALNTNGKKKFNEIDKEYGLKPGTADYTFHELVEKEVIRRVTISMLNLPIHYLAIILIKQTNIKRFVDNRKEYFLYRLKDRGLLTNRVSIIADVGAPYGIVSIIPIYNDSDLEKTEEDLKHILKGTIPKSTIITNILFGNIVLNKLETKEIPYYNVLTKEFKMTDSEISDYINK